MSLPSFCSRLSTAVVVTTFILLAGCNADKTSPNEAETCPGDVKCPSKFSGSGDGNLGGIAMVVASGSFTSDGILSPAAFLLNPERRGGAAGDDTSLELRLDLCCGYLFHGALLRDENLYDAFLETLLHATPFHGLSLASKRAMLPREAASIVDNDRGQGSPRVFTHTYQLTEEDKAFLNDGDGSRLILRSGVVGDAILSIPFASSGGGYDVQLMVSNKVLKCKCPHTLAVLPALRFVEDSIPKLDVVGIGASCNRETTMIDGPSAALVHRVSLRQPLPPYSSLNWVLYMERSASAGNGNDGSLATPITTHQSWVLPPRMTTTTGTSAESDYFSFRALPNQRYLLHLSVTRGRARASVQAGLVIRIPFSAEYPLSSIPVEPFFGTFRALKLVRPRPTDDLLHDALTSGNYAAYWNVSSPNGRSGEPQEGTRAGSVTRRINLTSSQMLEMLPGRGGTFYEEEGSEGTRHEHHLAAAVARLAPASGGLHTLLSVLTDVDEVCPPVLLEYQSLVALQPEIIDPPSSPTTACSDHVRLEARDDTSVLGPFAQTLAASGFLAVRLGDPQWDCRGTTLPANEKAPEGCSLDPSAHQRVAQLQVTQRSMIGLHWTMQVELELQRDALMERSNDSADLHLLLRRISDHPYMSSLCGEPFVVVAASSTTVTLRARLCSARHTIFRRSASSPAMITVSILTRDETVVAHAPVPGGQGYWRADPASSPLRVLSTSRNGSATISCARVSNTPQTLPRGSLQYMLRDPGEIVTDEALTMRLLFPWSARLLSRSLAEGRASGEEEDEASSDSPSSFHARCPDSVVEVQVLVTAAPPPVVVPDVEERYIESDMNVVLDAPRMRFKDETVSWRVITAAEGDENAPSGTGSRRCDAAQVRITPEGDSTRCVVRSGVPAHEECVIEWSVTNAVGRTAKRFQLYKCEPPPPLRMTSSSAGSVATAFIAAPESANSGAAIGDGNVVGLCVPFAVSSFASRSAERYLASDSSLVPYVHYYAHAVSPWSRFLVDYYPQKSLIAVTGKIYEQWNATDTGRPFEAPRLNDNDLDPASRYTLQRILTATDFDGIRRTLRNEFDAPGDGQGDNETASSSPSMFPLPAEFLRTEALSANSTLRVTISDASSHKSMMGRRARIRPAAAMHMKFRVSMTAEGMSTDDPPAAARIAQFEQRRLCAPRTGHFRILTVAPLNFFHPNDFLWPLVRPADDARKQSTPELPICHDEVLFSRNPLLGNELAYALHFQCAIESREASEENRGADSAVASPSVSPLPMVEVRDSVSVHVSSRNPGDAFLARCNITLTNTRTETVATDELILRRVFPTMFLPNVTVVSPNAAEVRYHSTAPPSAQNQRAMRGQPSTPPQPQLPGPDAKILRFFGPAVTLHVGPPATPSTAASATWRAVGFTPSQSAAHHSTGAGPSAAAVDSVVAVPLDPSTTNDNRSSAIGALTRLEGFHVAGLYRIVYAQPDPLLPRACPAVSLTQLLYVYRAQVVTRELVVCDSVAVVQAVPLPAELTHQFFGQWEVVSRQVSLNTTMTAGADFVGMRFDHGTRPRTTVRGLGFGIVTLRWAVYRSVTASPNSSTVVSRICVDEALVTLFVLTESLATSRLVTVNTHVDVASPSSAFHWRFETPPPTASRLFRKTTELTTTVLSNDTFSSRVSLTNLRVGVTRLLYDVRPSLLLPRWPALRNLKCPMQPPTRLFEVERVTAYLSLRNFSGHSECDAYLGHVNFTLCLEAGDASSKEFMEERIHLVDAEAAERVLKREAQSVERVFGCSIPWWLQNETKWDAVTVEDFRCLVIRVHRDAAAFLTPYEADHSMFFAAPRSSSSTRIRGGPNNADASTSTTPHPACDGSLSILSSLIIAGASYTRGAEEAFFFGDGRSTIDEASDEDGGQHVRALGDPVAPFLPLAVLPQRAAGSSGLSDAADIRLVALRGTTSVSDSVVSEGQLAGFETPVGAAVVWQMDVDTVPRRDAPLGSNTPSFGRVSEATANAFHDGITQSASRGEQQLVPFLSRCIAQQIRGSDVLSEFELMDDGGDTGAPGQKEGSNRAAWATYLGEVADSPVLCQPLFLSLESYLPTNQDTPESLKARRSAPIPATARAFVTVDILEGQLDALNASQHWTREGIDISGLPEDLQHALHRKRLTKKQLEELQRLRAMKRGSGLQQDPNAAQPSQQQLPVGHVAAASNESAATDSALQEFWSSTSYRERLVRAAEAHRKWAVHNAAEITAVRLLLPAAPSFATASTFRLRMGLAKTVLCGLQQPASSLPTESSVSAETHLSSRRAVRFHRMLVEDHRALISTGTLRVKQCDVEAAIPPLDVFVRNSNFLFTAPAGNGDHTRRALEPHTITLSEVPNPNITASPYPYITDNLGLTPCIPALLRGARLDFVGTTRKHLRLTLSPCPTFTMLSNEEYNERQESNSLVERLRNPRLLRIVLQGLVSPDQATVPPLDAIELVVAVVPTLVQSSLRFPVIGGSVSSALLFTAASEETFRDRRQLDQGTRSSAGGGVQVRETQGPTDDDALPLRSATAGMTHEEASEWVCESVLYERGAEFGISLTGDIWDNGVGASLLVAQARSDSAGSGLVTSEHPPASSQGAPKLQRVITDQDKAMLNGFSLVEHHTIPDGTYSFLAVATGAYRSSFLRFLFRSSWSEDNLRQTSMTAPVVHRYNDSFVSVRILPAAASSSAEAGPAPGAARRLPPVTPFAAVEEIWYAVPGTATRCKGCLLSDATFLVAGDASGYWSVPHPQENIYRRRDAPGGGNESPMLGLSSNRLRDALRGRVAIPFTARDVVPRLLSFIWLCQGRPGEYVDQFLQRHLEPNSYRRADSYLVTEVFVLASRDTMGKPIAPQHQPFRLLQSRPVRRVALVTPGPSTEFYFDEDAVDQAFDAMDRDVEQFLRSDALATTSRFDYYVHYPPGETTTSHKRSRPVALNATLVLQLCVPSAIAPGTLFPSSTDATSGAMCTVLFHHPATLLVRSGTPAAHSWLRTALKRTPHVLFTLGVAAMQPALQQQLVTTHHRVLATVTASILLALVSAYSDFASSLLWLGLWTWVFRSGPTIGRVVAFGVHGLLFVLGNE